MPNPCVRNSGSELPNGSPYVTEVVAFNLGATISPSPGFVFVLSSSVRVHHQSITFLFFSVLFSEPESITLAL